MAEFLRLPRFLVLLVAIVMVGGCASTPPSGTGSSPKTGTFKPYKIQGKTYHPLAHARGFSQRGLASWYGRKFHGRKTASGEVYNMYAMTAAHKTLPMDTWVEVTNLDNGRNIIIRINDRGPFVRNRIIDLSYTGAKKLGILGPGTAPVRVVALGKSSGKKKKDFIPVEYWKGDFTVQVGAFMELSNARAYRDKLSRKYDNAHITTHEDYRGTFYRVRVGKFSRLEAAQSFSRKLMQSGIDNAFAVAGG